MNPKDQYHSEYLLAERKALQTDSFSVHVASHGASQLVFLLDPGHVFMSIFE